LWIALIFVAAVSGLCMFVDARSRRRRKSVQDLEGSPSRADRIAEIERTDPGITQRSESWGQSSGPMGW
jgi:hypothetical protein